MTATLLRDDAVDALLPRIAAGDGESFATLVDRTSGRVYGLALEIRADPADAEAVSRAVYLAVWRDASTFDPLLGSGLCWLLALTRRHALALGDAANGARIRVAASHSSEPRLRDRLSPTDRAMLDLAWCEGLTHREIASRLGLPLHDVPARLRHAMTLLGGRVAVAEPDPRLRTS